MSLSDIYAAQGKFIDNMVGAFADQLGGVISKAQARLIARLQKQLVIEHGRIAMQPANLRTLRKLDDLFSEEMDKAGYGALINAFVDKFPGQLKYMSQIIEDINATLKRPLIPVKPTGATTDMLSSFQVNVTDALQAVVANAARAALTRGLYNVAGLSFGKLTETLAGAFNRSLSEARTLAETGMSIFSRVAMNGQFAAVQAGQRTPLLYEYSGPSDNLTRRFCREMLDEDKPRTMDEWERVDNGSSLGSVPNCGGGYSCRHQLQVNVSSLRAAAAQMALAA
jgi:hypothetical protein